MVTSHGPASPGRQPAGQAGSLGPQGCRPGPRSLQPSSAIPSYLLIFVLCQARFSPSSLRGHCRSRSHPCLSPQRSPEPWHTPVPRHCLQLSSPAGRGTLLSWLASLEPQLLPQSLLKFCHSPNPPPYDTQCQPSVPPLAGLPPPRFWLALCCSPDFLSSGPCP